MKKRTSASIIYMILVSFTALGQTQANDKSDNSDSWTKVGLQRIIKFENESKSFDVKINIKENVQRFEFRLSSSIKRGKLTIEFYDPKGIKRGNFAIGTQMNSEIEETAHGNIEKSLFEPQPGDWEVKIIPLEATGDIRIRTTVREYSIDED